MLYWNLLPTLKQWLVHEDSKIVFWVTTRIDLHSLVLKMSFLILSSAVALYLLSVLTPVSVKACPNTQSALIGQLKHAWPSTTNNNSCDEGFMRAKLAAWHKWCKCMTWLRNAMSQSQGGTTHEVFQRQCFLWERGASLGAASYQDILHTQEPILIVQFYFENPCVNLPVLWWL